MRILLIHPFFYPHKGGSERYAEELLVHLVKQHPETSVDVLTYETGKGEYYRGLQVFRVPSFNFIGDTWRLPNPLFLIPQLISLSRNKYDFVYTHVHFFDTTWWAWAYARLIGARSFITVHGADWVHHHNPLVQLVVRLVEKTIGAWSLGRYDVVTAVSEATKGFVVRELAVGEGGKGSKGSKEVRVVFNGVDTEMFKPARGEMFRRLPKVNRQFGREDVIITFVGRLIWSKGVNYLLKAFKELAVANKSVFLVVAGEGELKGELEGRLGEYGLLGKVFLVGGLSSPEVAELLGKSDIFVNPSLVEGLPTTLLEAGASGCCVVATDVGGTGEVIRDGETGLLVGDVREVGVVLDWAIAHRVERERMSQNLRREVINKFDWEAIAAEFYKLLNTDRRE